MQHPRELVASDVAALSSIVVLERRFNEYPFTSHDVLDVLQQPIQQGSFTFTEERLRLGILKVLACRFIVGELLVDASYELSIADKLAGHRILLNDPIEIFIGEVDVEEVEGYRESRTKLIFSAESLS